MVNKLLPLTWILPLKNYERLSTLWLMPSQGTYLYVLLLLVSPEKAILSEHKILCRRSGEFCLMKNTIGMAHLEIPRPTTINATLASLER